MRSGFSCAIDVAIKTLQDPSWPVFDPPKMIFPNKAFHGRFIHELSKMMTVIAAPFVSLEECFFERIKSPLRPFLAGRSDMRDAIATIIFERKTEDWADAQEVLDYLRADGPEWERAVRVFELSDMLSRMFFEYDEEGVWDRYSKSERLKGDSVFRWEHELFEDSASFLESRGKAILSREIERTELGKTVFSDVVLIGFDTLPPKKGSLRKRVVNLMLQSGAREIGTGDIDDAASPSSITLSGAVSRLREVENVHRQICELLLCGEERLDDIAVYASRMSDYFTPVMQVFACGGDFDVANDDVDVYPSIPFSMSASSATVSAVSAGIATLKGIMGKGWLDRCDVASMLDNRAVRSAAGISDDDAEKIRGWISGEGIYRDRQVGGRSIAQWEMFEYRLAASLLLNDAVRLSFDFDDEDGILRPYRDICSDDRDLLFKCFRIIDDLENFCVLFLKGGLKSGDLDRLHDVILSLFGSQSDDEDLSDDWRTLVAALSEIGRIKSLILDGRPASLQSIPFSFVMSAIQDAAASAVVRIRRFGGGVRFSDLCDDALAPAKHVFLLGMGMDDFRDDDISSGIDLRSRIGEFAEKEPKGLELLRSAFKCAESGVFLSYRRYDLQKDAELYVSPYVEKVIGGRNDVHRVDVGLDAIRFSSSSIPHPRIWTARVKRNHDLLQGSYPAFSPIAIFNEAEKSVSQVEECAFTLRDIAGYLEDPFMWFANKAFRQRRDAFEREGLEPLSPNALERSLMLRKLSSMLIAAGGDDEQKKRLEAGLADELNQMLSGDRFFAQIAAGSIAAAADVIGRRFADLREFIYKEYDGKFAFDETLNLEIGMGGGRKARVKGDLPMYAFRQEPYGLLVVGCRERKGNPKHMLPLYVASLALISMHNGRDEGDKHFSVALALITAEGSEDVFIRMKKDGTPVKGSPSQAKCMRYDFLMTPHQASEILSGICDGMTGEFKCCPISLISKDVADARALEKLLLSQSGAWRNFEFKRFFDIRRDAGFADDDFEGSWKLEVAKRKRFLLFLQ